MANCTGQTRRLVACQLTWHKHTHQCAHVNLTDYGMHALYAGAVPEGHREERLPGAAVGALHHHRRRV